MEAIGLYKQRQLHRVTTILEALHPTAQLLPAIEFEPNTENFSVNQVDIFLFPPLT
jgi:hypothetical protein